MLSLRRKENIIVVFMFTFLAYCSDSNIILGICLLPGMTVLYAYFGQTCAKYINIRNQIRSTGWVKSLCQGKLFCSGTVSISILTDPYSGCGKDFLAIAKCPNGAIIADVVPEPAERKSFTLNCYLRLGKHNDICSTVACKEVSTCK